MSGNSYNRSYILGLSFISALGGYLFGFDFAVISGALPFLRDQFGLVVLQMQIGQHSNLHDSNSCN